MRSNENEKNRGAHGDSLRMLDGLPSSNKNTPALAVGSVNPMIEKTPFLRALFPQLDTSRQEKYTLSLPGGAKKIIRDFALEHGYASFNDFVKHAIWEQIERDSAENSDDSKGDPSGFSK